MAVSDIVLPITFRSDARGLKKAERQLSKFGRGVGKIAAGATAAVAGIAAGSVKAFADFDASLQKSVSIMGDVSDAMRDDMAEAAREVAKATTFSADQAGEAFFFLASAGLDAEQSIAAMPKVAQFAQAGMFDMAQATDLLTDAQSALGLTSDDTATNLDNMVELSDMLVKSNTLANASVQQFSEALTNKAAASMRSLNIETETGLAVLAVFADQGIKGSEAGTKFNAAIRGLTNGVQRNAAEFERLNIEVFDSQGNFRNFADIVSDMEAALGDLSVEEQRAALAQLGFTEETLVGTLALLGNSDAIREYESEIANAGGTTEDVANKQLQTFTAQLSLLKSAFVDVGIGIGSDLVPALTSLVEMMGPALEEAGPALKDMFLSLVPVIMQLVDGLPEFISALTPVIPLMGEIAGVVFEAAVTALPIFAAILQALLPVFQTLASALRDNAALITILVISIGGIIKVGTALSGLITVFKAFSTVAGFVFKFLKGFGAVFSIIGGLVTKLVAGFKVFMTVLTAVRTAFVAFSAVLIANPIGLIITAIGLLIAGLAFFFTQTERGKEIWANFVAFFQNLITNMGLRFQESIDRMVANFAVFDEKVRAFSQMIADFFLMVFGELIPGIWQGMIDFFVTAYEGFIDGFKTGFEGLKDFFRNLVNGYITIWEGFINLAIRGINSLINKANTFSIDIPDWVEGIGGRSFGINIPNISEVSLPRLAEGGIVDRTTIAMIGEAGPEAVIPLDKLDRMGGPSYTINVSAGVGDPVRIGEEVVTAIKRYERVSGPVFASA